MIKQHYSGSARRAMNVIWNAAQDYDFASPFLAFHPTGEPDQYFNMIIGLTAKWLDMDRVTDFFVRLGEGPTLDEASSILWLGIEHCVYGKELPQRPVLETMRRERAEEFFRVSGMMSEQQMMFQSVKVYDQEQARWSRVLGRRVLGLTPGEKRLADELEFPAAWGTDEVLDRMTQILRSTFRITLPDTPGQPAHRTGGLRRALANAFGTQNRRQADLLVLRRGSGTGDHRRAVHLTHNAGELHTSADAQKDRRYIEEAFGPCMYTDQEMRILEGNLCTGDDALCRLWFTKSGESGSGSTKDGRQLAADRLAQRRRNEKYCRDHVYQITENIRRLSAQTEAVFRSWLQYLPESAKHGRVDAQRIWRLPVLDDARVFLTDSDMAEYTLSVDLLLDASQSRMNSQEQICAQALVIARAFENCRIPVRVTAFRSLRGYTVLERLKEYGDRRADGLMRYYAGGWNRDGLCLRAMDYLMEEERKELGRKRILLVLTDASPNDSVPLPPRPGSLFTREYEGDEAVQAAESAVRSLRSHGVMCGAVYYGSSSHLDSVHQIYGQQYVRIRSLSQLADAVSSLLQADLRKLH